MDTSELKNMNTLLKDAIDIYQESGQLDFKKIKLLYGVSNDVLAEMLGVGESTLRMPTVSQFTLRKSQILIHILNMLWILCDKNEWIT